MAQSLSTDTVIIAIAVIWSILLPSFPDTLFVLLDSLVGVFLLLLIVLLVLPQGAVPGVLVVIAVALTFVERNRRKIQNKLITSTNVQPVPATYEEQMAAAPPMSPMEVHPDYEVMHAEEAEPFFPQHDANDQFESIAPTINEKNVIPTISSNTDTAERYFVQQHLGKTELD